MGATRTVVPVGHDGPVNGSQDSPSPLAPLVAEVRRLRGSDPMGRITVIVASFGAARDLVRAMALSGGAVNVAVRTAAQVITELSGPALAPRAALPLPLLEAAVEKALDADPGRLRAVASEPVTGLAVAQACRRLGTVEEGSVAPETPLHGEVLRLAEQAHAMTGRAYFTPFEAVAAGLGRLGPPGGGVPAGSAQGSVAVSPALAVCRGFRRPTDRCIVSEDAAAVCAPHHRRSVRVDTQSTTAAAARRALDDTLWLRRAHAVGHERQHLNLLTPRPRREPPRQLSRAASARLESDPTAQ